MVKASSNGLSSDLAGGVDTIVARATPAGRGALALIRVSGAQTPECAARVCPDLRFGAGWKATLTTVLDSEGEPLERAVVTSFPGPRSFTGEDMLEVAVHGSPFLVEAVIEAFVAAGARLAGAGEFTRRAVANGKLDLVQAEAIRDLVAADTASQHRNARQQLAGALSVQFRELRATLVTLLATIEASLDYEAQGVVVPAGEMAAQREECRRQLAALLATASAGERLREGMRLVILGSPNSGKSTLFNHLAGTERAIVSPRPGTTRDLVETGLDLGGVRIVVQDTAGLRVGGDEIEAEGHRRAQAAAAAADLAVVLWAVDAGIDADLAAEAANLPAIRVRSKIDLAPGEKVPDGWLGISCHSGEGLEDFRHELLRRILGEVPDLGGAVAIAARHRRALGVAASELEACDVERPDTAAENVRWALRAVDELIGEVSTDDVLDEIYGSFCIGK
ncbi:MAG: tRNA uridine-5-carboxymethylaminomethyl(34) synthesis GTPase MnmE [Acidobacteria bacterium]|nr:tRNA uridine-5-carboxymethylaminomethyl(34) synthesis GTPase MnmE [Candidatus Sulfomarinibacter kjeldsenii]